MPATPQLSALVQALVPLARSDENLRRELIENSQDILSTHIGQNKDGDITHLGGIIQRRLLQSSPTSGGLEAQRFRNLLSRLLEQKDVTRKHAILLFLDSLSLSQPDTATPSSSSFLPSLAPQTSQALRITQNQPAPAQSGQDTSRPPSGKSKAEILRNFRAKAGHPHIPESLLVRDSLYVLQGISGNYAQFVTVPNADGNEKLAVTLRESSRFVIPSPTRDLVIRLSETGHLYLRVSAFVQAVEGKPSVGLIKQSLCHHLQTQLTEYYRMVAVLESQMASGEAQLSSSNDPQYDTGLTLRRLEVWTEEWKLRMRMMSACVESCRDSKGGALVSEIHKYTDNGDPFIRHFTDQLLEEVSKPFFVTLHRWIYSGELHDPFDEFFVAVDPALAGLHHAAGASYDVDDRTRESGLNLWTSKYTFREEMLPRFVGREFGRKIFSTGKSLNFIRYSCQDSEWVATRNKISTTGKVLKYSDIAGLERTIDSAYQIASQRLFDVFFEKFKLMDHLAALKNYLLLGHGDFAEHLMETLAPNLSKPANSLQRHKLTSSLETAIRATNAQFDPPDVLRRLDARMLEFTHGEIGWDVFTLEYKVDSPIDTVLDPDSMKKYLRIFGHLWRLKRVDAALTACWMRITSGSRAFLRVPSLAKHWHQVRIAMSEMIFFVRQFQTYVHLVVVEDCWNELQEFLKKKEGDLDSLIQAHRQYLQRVTTRILLLRNRQGKEEQYLGQVREALEFALQFVEAVDSLYNYSLSEAARIDMVRDSERGVYTNASAREGRRTPESDTLLRTLHRIKEYSVKFSDRAVHVAIPIQAHDDPKCKVLGHILAFSDFYPNKRQRMREEQGTSSEIRQF